MKPCLLPSLLFSLLSCSVAAAPISILVGDNDGFGAGIADGADGSVITEFQQGNIFDRREAGETTAVNGAQLTDLYSFIFPTLAVPLAPFNPSLFDALMNEGDDPRASNRASVLFPFVGNLLSGNLLIDVLDYQSDGYIGTDINGFEVDFGRADGFSASSVRSFSLTPEQIAEANRRQTVELNLLLDVNFGRESGGDLIAFDFFRFDGELSETAVPTPPVSWLLVTGLVGLLLTRAGRRERRQQARSRNNGGSGIR